MKPMEKTKQLNDLTLLDRFLFASVMEDEETLELALSIIMGEEVHLRQPNQVEKEFRTMPWLRSVRLDVYNVDDKDRLYDAEVQERNTGNLAKRSRFYQALIDSTLLPPGRGVSFNQLPASYLIMIMPFDLWGCGKYRYTFKTQCEEVPGPLPGGRGHADFPQHPRNRRRGGQPGADGASSLHRGQHPTRRHSGAKAGGSRSFISASVKSEPAKNLE